MSDKLIRAAFESRLYAWANAREPKLPIAFEDVEFTPPSDGNAYLQAYLLPSNTDSADLEGAHVLYQGVFQISIVTAAGNGRGAASAIADELRALFPNNLSITQDGLTVFVMTPLSTAAAIAGDTTTSMPTSFRYRADTF
ncbi:MAG: phage tail terminator-like protein [Janthinobacterium lividum]